MIIAKYECPTCNTDYPTRNEAEKCFAQEPTGILTGISVGDIVLADRSEAVSYRFGWYDGKEHWVALRKQADPSHADHFAHHDTFGFYYVVTAMGTEEFSVTGRSHRMIYYLRTLAMETGYSGGWTCQSHTKITRVEPTQVPSLVIEEARKLVGEKRQNLL